MTGATRALLVLLLLSTPAVSASDLLCISSPGGERECREVASTGDLTVTASPVRRAAVWIADDRSRVVVFAVAPEAAVVRVPSTGNEIRYAVSTRKLPRGARQVEYELTDADSRTSWRWALPGRAAHGTIVAPDGNYTLEVTAEHAQPVGSRAFTTTGGKPIDLGTLELVPKLFVTGKLVNENGQPVVNGTIGDDSGSLSATSGGDGVFTIAAVTEQLPATLAAQAEGYVTRELAVPDRRESYDAGEIVLERGVPLAIKVAMKGDHALPRGTSVAVYAMTREGKRLVERQALPPDRAVVTFRRVGTGKHIVEVAGPAPLQRRAIPIETPAPAGPHEIAITPRTVRGHVYFGTDALSGAKITIYPRHQLWDAEQVLGEEGEFGGPLWDDGLFGAVVEGGRLTIPFAADKTIARDAEDWDIVIPDNAVSGRVVDARTKRPIPGARVSYETLGTMRLSSSVPADDDGRYEITGLSEGTLTLRAASTGYLTSQAVTVPIGAGQRRVEQVLALEAGVALTVRVVDDLDRPVTGATIIDPILGPSRFTTDERGEATIPVSQERPRRVWIVPREGSLSAASLKPTDAQPVRVVLPSGTGSIAVTVRRDDGAPLRNVRFVIAYNGELVPDAVWRMVAHVQGFDWITDAAGVTRHPRLPAGTYELWPHVSAAEGRSIARNPAVTAPVARVRLNAGDDQVVTVVVTENR